MKISVPVKREFPSPIIAEREVVLVAGTAFLLGALITLLVVSAAFPVKDIQDNGTLASVASQKLMPSLLDRPFTEIERNGGVSEVAVEIAPTEALPPAINPVSATKTSRTTAELHLLIADRENAMFRITEELERVKNESINTTATFSQNCNNWNDYCAGQYKERLNALNSEYARLSELLSQLSNELAELRAERGY